MLEMDSVEKLCLELPLYAKIDIPESNINLIKELNSFKGTVTCYCPECRDDSIFKAQNDQFPKFPGMGMTAEVETKYLLQDRLVEIVLYCVRNQNHQNARFYFQIYQKQLIKIGQYPSLADMAVIKLKAYQKVLSKDDYKDLNRAIGLAAHGVGIGSFVYLRRIFERIIFAAKARAIAEGDAIDEERFNKRMEDRIDILKKYLPQSLVENKQIYGILSLGIHELNEDICLDAFEIIKSGITIMLDEEIRQREEEQNRKTFKKGFQSILEFLKTNKNENNPNK